MTFAAVGPDDLSDASEKDGVTFFQFFQLPEKTMGAGGAQESVGPNSELPPRSAAVTIRGTRWV